MALQDKVSAGAELLDEKRPGWYLQVDLDDLDMSMSGHCVLGQLDESFWWSAKRLFGTSDNDVLEQEVRDYGFWLDRYEDTSYPELDTFWSNEIQYRLDNPNKFLVMDHDLERLAGTFDDKEL